MSRSRNATRLSRALLALAVGAALAVPAAALAQAPKYTLKFNHVLGPKEPYHAGFQNWAKRVEERTKGGLRMEVFHSAQLGKEEDIIEQIRQGANIGQNTDSARMGNYVPGIAVMNGPYFVETLDEVNRLRKAPTVQKWQDELAGKHGLKVVCFNWVQGYRHFFTNKPVRNPEDLKGQRIRTPPAPIWQESIRALGAAPVAMAFGEMYPGAAAESDRRRRARLQQHPRRPLLRGAEVRQRDEAHHADQFPGGQREVVRRAAARTTRRSSSRNASAPATRRRRRSSGSRARSRRTCAPAA